MAALDLIQEYCGWHVAPSRAETVEAEGDGGRVLLLPSLHVTSVTAVRDESGVEVSDFKSRKNGVLRGCWRNEELYRVDIVHGFDAMPSEIEDILADLESRSTPSGALVQVGQVRYATASDGSPLGAHLTGAQKAILDRYKLPPRP